MAERRVLVDTSVWVHLLRHGAPASLADQVTALTQAGRTVTAGPVRLELLRGARTEAGARLIRERFHALPDLEVTPALWDRAGDIGFLLARRGVSVAGMDLLLAAITQHHDCALLHLDGDFDRIARLVPLHMEVPAWRPG